MKQSNLLLNISDQQLQQAGLTRAQARKSLAALDYRDNDVFRHVMNAENPVSRKILTMYLSDLLHRRIVWIGSEATEPVKANFREKGVRYDVMVRIRDDQGKPMLVNLEMQNYRMAESLSLRSQGYASRMVSDQIEVGGSFDFIPVLQIMITGRMPEMKASREYLHYHRYTNKQTDAEGTLPDALDRDGKNTGVGEDSDRTMADFRQDHIYASIQPGSEKAEDHS